MYVFRVLYFICFQLRATEDFINLLAQSETVGRILHEFEVLGGVTQLKAILVQRECDTILTELVVDLMKKNFNLSYTQYLHSRTAPTLYPPHYFNLTPSQCGTGQQGELVASPETTQSGE